MNKLFIALILLAMAGSARAATFNGSLSKPTVSPTQLNTILATFDTIANRQAHTLSNSALSTFELTASLLNRGYTTSAAMNVALGTFETSSHASSTYYTQANQTSLIQLIGDPTGFQTPESVTVNYDKTSRTVSLSGSCNAFWRGTQVASIVSGYTSPTHDATTGLWYLSYDGSSIAWSQTVWTFDKLQIAAVYYSTNDAVALRETHGFMPWQVHKELHNTFGTYMSSGGDITSIVTGSTTAANRRPTISSTVINDEDLQTTNTTTNQAYSQLFLSTSQATPVFTLEATDIVQLAGNHPNYNQFTGGQWIETAMPNNTYMCIWLVAVPTTASVNSQKYRYLFVQGQSTSATLATQQGLTPSSLTLSALTSMFTEFAFIDKIIINYTSAGTNWNVAEVDKLSGTKVSQSATPTGTYLSAVSTDGTLSGDGSSSNVLSASPVVSSFETTAAFNTAVSTATKEVEINLISEKTLLSTTWEAYFVIPSSLNGKTLKTVKSHVFTASTSGTPEFQITNTAGNLLLGPTSRIDVNTKDSQNSTTAEAVISAYATATATNEYHITVISAGTGATGANLRLMWQ